MTLRDAIADDANTVFLNGDEFAETVIYHPHRYYGEVARSARTIKAVVLREAISVLTQDGDTVAFNFQVHVANDAVTGISSEELDTGGDKLEFAPRDGKAAEVRSITQLTTQDHGMLVLECR